MKKIDTFFLGCFSGIILFIICFAIINPFIKTITPMDVYQGKTTLKYEVIDSVKVDSMVVWKENIK